MNMIKVVIFDFDGVLADSNELWADIFDKASKKTGIKKKFTYDDIRPYYGRPVVEIFKSAHPRFREDKDVMAAMYSNFMSLATSDEFADSFKTFSGLKGALTKLKKKCKLAVGSGNSKKLLNRFLGKLGLTRYFDLVVASDDVDNGKPNPDMLLKIINHFGVSPDEAIYVGDSDSDIIAAKRANMKSVAVLTGALSQDQAKELEPDFIVKDATQLQEVLECM
jgi:HAD superfamily hydrolase (TIGR01549 family)